ncbi:MAG: SurA N-terminal domain-containing protein [Pseudomonadota bacterium]|jgi:peptidyl-prolyl cis-trans isomerase D
MLQDFRASIGRYGKWLVVLIAIPFVFFGVESIFFSGAAVDEVAEVDGESISRLELEQAVQRQRSYLMQRLGEAYSDAIDEKSLRAPVLQSLIATQALANRAVDHGMGVPPQLIAKVLQDAELFWVDGRFSRDNYLVYLQQMGYTPQSHNRFLTRELLVDQLVRGVTQTAFVTASEFSTALTLLEETRDFHYLTIPFDGLDDQPEIAAEEIEQYYRQHPDRFTAPEQVVLNYLELSRDAIEPQIEVDEAQLRERYRERVAAAEAAKQRVVAQILVESRADGSHRDKLEAIERDLSAGKPFADVAAAQSEDRLTAERGGELGPYVAADYPPQLREVIESLQIGQISAPVETEQGWHILTVLREDQPEVGSFAEEREKLRREIMREQAQQRFSQLLDRLGELAYNSEDLAAVAGQLGLELKVSSPMGRDGSGERLGAFPKVVEAAFGDQVLEDGYPSPVIEIGEGQAVVIELREHRPAALRPLDQVREEIRGILNAERAQRLATERGQRIKARLDAGESLADIAAEQRLEWHAHLDVGRYDQQLDRELVEKVFGVPARQAESAPRSGVFAGADAAVVYQVIDIHPGSPEVVPAARQRELATALLGAISRQELDRYQALLMAAAKIDVQPLALEEAQ